MSEWPNPDPKRLRQAEVALSMARVGDEIRRLRIKRGLTLRGLCAKLGVSPPFLSDDAAKAARYRARHPEVPVIENLDKSILQALNTGGTLDMGAWHTCETTHCRAGWAITLGGDAGRKLEEKYGPQIAGGMIYRASTGRLPYFFASTEDALEDIRKCAQGQP